MLGSTPEEDSGDLYGEGGRGSTPASSIGSRIVEAREAHGLSTAQLARRLGVKTRTLSSWEHGQSEPRANRLTTLAGVLGVSPLWLLTGVGDSPETDISHLKIATLRANLADLKHQAEHLVDEIERVAASIAPGQES